MAARNGHGNTHGLATVTDFRKLQNGVFPRVPMRQPFGPFAESLRSMRECRGWSQAQLAKESGFDQSTICRLESGERTPTAGTATLLAEALQAGPEDRMRLILRSGSLPEGLPAPIVDVIAAFLARNWQGERQEAVG